MKTTVLVALGVFVMNTRVIGQKSLLFIKNESRYAAYRIGDEISFTIDGSRQKMTNEIMRIEDSLLVFNTWKLPIHEISSVYVDEKTKRWYPMRYKYDELLPLAGGAYLVADVANSGRFNKNTLLISGLLACGGVAAKLLIGDTIKLKHKRKLITTGNSPGALGTYR
ncbi:hypothetical protein [Salmonirosea aquatica]|uniref:Uncharacterized protein n=1 Tax=Salmonirosea aquatica TaxID=2654236 RepID=A0A7C9FRU5_9BACT|nr:hypothetical protein [Cytophagaceae bacterium SJW1-29]